MKIANILPGGLTACLKTFVCITVNAKNWIICANFASLDQGDRGALLPNFFKAEHIFSGLKTKAFQTKEFYAFKRNKVSSI